MYIQLVTCNFVYGFSVFLTMYQSYYNYLSTNCVFYFNIKQATNPNKTNQYQTI